MNKQSAVYPYNEILPGDKKQWAKATPTRWISEAKQGGQTQKTTYCIIPFI